MAFLLLLPVAAWAAPRQVLSHHVPAIVARLNPVGALNAAQHIQLAIGLPSRDQAGLDQFLKDLANPASPHYRKYLTPAQFDARFGPTQADYQALINFAKSKGLRVTATHPSRLLLDVDGDVAHVQAAFHVTLRTYRHPTENRIFYAPDTEPSLDFAIPVSHISGLENYSLPHPTYKVRSKSPAGGARPKPAAGSGPGSSYAGNDFRAAYLPGAALTGSGQVVGLLQFDGYYPVDIANYRQQFNLPSIPLVNVPVDGGISTPGSNNVEVCLDIEMTNSMAPGLSAIYVYEAPDTAPWDDVILEMAEQDIANQLSASWTSSGGPDSNAETIYEKMISQGQSYFNASGDSDAYVGQLPFPVDSPHVTAVGATTLTTTGQAVYSSETAWNWGYDSNAKGYVGTSGGISTYYDIPTWQAGTSMAANQGSTTMRNVPDVAFVGDNVYVDCNDGSDEIVGGTSCASPLWAAFMALVNQSSVSNNQGLVGFVNQYVYSLGQDFNDITTGNNFWPGSPSKFAAVAGYDLCTGMGTPTNALLAALTGTSNAGGPYTVTPGAGSNGSISPNTAQSVNSGGGITFIATPSTGYTVNQWLLNGVEAQTSGTLFTVNNVMRNDSVQVTFTATPSSAVIQSPSPGTSLTSSTATFNWNAGSGVSGYFLYVGSSRGAYDIFNSGQLPSNVLSQAVTGIPTDGREIYVTLWSDVNGTWESAQYTYTAASASSYTVTPGAGANGTISPNTPQTVSRGGSAAFTATPNNGYVVNQWLLNGSVAQGGGTNYTLYDVTANDSVEVTFGLTPTPAQISTPIPGTTLSSASVTFDWTAGVGNGGYQLYVGSSSGADDIYASGILSAATLSQTVNGIPTNSATIYVTLRTELSGAWDATSYTYTAAPPPPSGLTYSTNPAVYTKGAAITANTPNSTGGVVAAYSVSPALPQGLTLNTSTGIITGTPTVVAAPASYTVTGSNTTGYATVLLNITVNDVPPSNLGYAINPVVYTKGTAISANNPSNSGGTIVSYSVTPSLPSGLSLNTSTGAITGDPVAVAAAASYTVTGSNSGGSTTASINITVNDVPPSRLAYSTNPAVYTKGTNIFGNRPGNSGGAITGYSVAPGLPAGLNLNAATGVITGAPTVVAAASNYIVTASNSGGSTTASVKITVNDVPPSGLVYSTNPAVFTKGTLIATDSPGNGGGTVISYSVAPALPAGLTLNTVTGTITGTPTVVAAASSYIVTATNSGGSTTASVNITVNDVAPSSLTYATNPATYTKGTQITANDPGNSGGTITGYSVSPPLPAGLTLNLLTGVITGTPTSLAAASSYTVTGTNSGGSTTASVNIAVNDLAPSSLTYATNPATYKVGTAIASNSPSSSGGAVVAYAVSPSLPAGLSLDTATGVITGTPSVPVAANNYIVTATNSGGYATASLNITVNDVAPASLSYSGNPVTYTLGTAISPNIPSSGGGAIISYSVNPALPQGLSLSTSTGVITGTPGVIVAASNYVVTGTNTGGATTASVSIAVKNSLPVAVPQTVDATTHQPAALTLTATELIDVPTTFNVVIQPAHGTLSGTPPDLTYVSNAGFAGTDSFAFDATDSGGISAPATVTLAVSPVASKKGYFVGRYVGLISGTDAADGGTVKLQTTAAGDFSGSLTYGGVKYALSGSLGSEGIYQRIIQPPGSPPVPVQLNFTLPGPGAIDMISGTVGDSPVTAGNAIYSSTVPAPQAGRYTVIIPPDPSQTDAVTAPQGYGVGTLVVTKAGAITFAGTTADGAKFSQGTSLTRNGVWYLYAPLYGKGARAGMLEGTIQFEQTPDISDLDGAITWEKPSLPAPAPATSLYPLGFNLATHLYGATYSKPAGLVLGAGLVNNFTAQSGTSAGETFTEPASAKIADSNIKVTGSSGLSLTVTDSTGRVAGSYLAPGTGVASPVSAIIYQAGTPTIYGSFTGIPESGFNQAGSVIVTGP